MRLQCTIMATPTAADEHQSDATRAAIDVSAALNRLLSRLRWLEPTDQGQLTWRDWNNNVHLAAAVSSVRGTPTSHVQIHRIRQGVNPDPRGSILWAIGRVLSDHSPVPITPDYFWVPTTRAAVDLAIDAQLRQFRDRYARARRP